MICVVSKGTIYGITAFEIFRQLVHHKEVECFVLEIAVDNGIFNHLKSSCLSKKKSNCRLEVTTNTFEKYIVCNEPIQYSFQLQLILNHNVTTIFIEDILLCQIRVLLAPILNLRRCNTLDEALMNWSLNNSFIPQKEYIDHKKLVLTNMVECNQTFFKEIFVWFLRCKNISKFVPTKFLNKVIAIQKSKTDIKTKYICFMDIIVLINKYFTNIVQKYMIKNDLSVSIELYGYKQEVLSLSRKSLYLVEKKGCLRLKSFAILFNLRWFFNTMYNCKKSIGLDGEYGHTENGYGQTFHKYDDMIKWVITHPNALKDAELVVLDPIPTEYIFNDL